MVAITNLNNLFKQNVAESSFLFNGKSENKKSKTIANSKSLTIIVIGFLQRVPLIL